MKKLIKKWWKWFAKWEPEPCGHEAELEQLRAANVEARNTIAYLEGELAKAKAGNKALQDFITARHEPDKTLTPPPKIVKPFAVLAILALTLCAQAQFPPPYVHNYWDTNANPIVMTVSNGIIVTNMTADVRNTQFFGFRLGTTLTPYAFMFETAATTDRLRGTNAVTHDWIDFNDGIDLGNLANTRVIMLRTSSGDVSATTFTGSGANLTALNASQVTSGTLNSTLLSGTTNAQLSAITMPVNVGGVSFFTNAASYTVFYAVKGTSISVGVTTVSSYPTSEGTVIGAATQTFVILHPNDVAMVTNASITGAQSSRIP